MGEALEVAEGRRSLLKAAVDNSGIAWENVYRPVAP